MSAYSASFQAVIGSDGIDAEIENEAIAVVHELIPAEKDRNGIEFMNFACAGESRTALAARLGLPHVARRVNFDSTEKQMYAALEMKHFARDRAPSVQKELDAINFKAVANDWNRILVNAWLRKAAKFTLPGGIEICTRDVKLKTAPLLKEAATRALERRLRDALIDTVEHGNAGRFWRGYQSGFDLRARDRSPSARVSLAHMNPPSRKRDDGGSDDENPQRAVNAPNAQREFMSGCGMGGPLPRDEDMEEESAAASEAQCIDCGALNGTRGRHRNWCAFMAFFAQHTVSLPAMSGKKRTKAKKAALEEFKNMTAEDRAKWEKNGAEKCPRPSPSEIAAFSVSRSRSRSRSRNRPSGSQIAPPLPRAPVQPPRPTLPSSRPPSQPPPGRARIKPMQMWTSEDVERELSELDSQKVVLWSERPYHERQQANLCAKHALNNCLGSPVLKVRDMVTAATQLEQEHSSSNTTTNNNGVVLKSRFRGSTFADFSEDTLKRAARNKNLHYFESLEWEQFAGFLDREYYRKRIAGFVRHEPGHYVALQQNVTATPTGSTSEYFRICSMGPSTTNIGSVGGMKMRACFNGQRLRVLDRAATQQRYLSDQG